MEFRVLNRDGELVATVAPRVDDDFERGLAAGVVFVSGSFTEGSRFDSLAERLRAFRAACSAGDQDRALEISEELDRLRLLAEGTDGTKYSLFNLQFAQGGFLFLARTPPDEATATV